MKNNLTILSTKILKPYIKNQLLGNDFNVVEHDFIKLINIEAPEAKSIVTSHLPNYIFTSKKGVKSFVEYVSKNKITLDKKSNFYALSGETQIALEDEGYKVNFSKDNAQSLANEIISVSKEKKFIFFCGNKRRVELPDAMHNAGLQLTEIVLYKNILQPLKINVKYEAVLFFSPSAVQSFFSKNKVAEKTTLFAIGNTTANEIKKFSNNKIVISDEPGKENLVQKMIEYFAP